AVREKRDGDMAVDDGGTDIVAQCPPNHHTRGRAIGARFEPGACRDVHFHGSRLPRNQRGGDDGAGPKPKAGSAASSEYSGNSFRQTDVPPLAYLATLTTIWF